MAMEVGSCDVNLAAKGSPLVVGGVQRRGLCLGRRLERYLLFGFLISPQGQGRKIEVG